MRVLVVYKKSSQEMLQRDPQKYRQLKKKHPKIFQKFAKNHQTHKKSLEKVIQVLKKKKCQITVEYRSRVSLVAKSDLVVTVGGDGTFLEAARSVRDVPMLAVNSDPKMSVAHFSACTAQGFERVFSKLGTDDYPLKRIYRLQASVNDKLVKRPILNDLLIAHRNPAATTRIQLKTPEMKALYKCSGIWVATAAGSTAAIKSAGGKALSLFSRRWQYLVREPYDRQRKMPYGQILQKNSTITIECGSSNTRLYIDGPHHSHSLEIGDQIKVSQDPLPLRVYRCR